MSSESIHIHRRHFIRTSLMALPAACWMPGEAAASASRIPTLNDLRFIAKAMPIRRRYEWASVPPNLSRLRLAMPNRYHRITVHHTGLEVITATAESSVVRCMDGVLAGHLDRRFGDIGYHFLIDYAGRVWEGRSLAYWGAHVSGHNEHNIGIVLLGNYERQRPQDVQLRSLAQLAHLLRHHYAIRHNEMYGHIDLGQTLCPGKYLYPAVRQMNQLA